MEADEMIYEEKQADALNNLFLDSRTSSMRDQPFHFGEFLHGGQRLF